MQVPPETTPDRQSNRTPIRTLERRHKRIRFAGRACLMLAVIFLVATVVLCRSGLSGHWQFGNLHVFAGTSASQVSVEWSSKTGISYNPLGWSYGFKPWHWQWRIPPGGNEVIAPYRYIVWYIPGFVEYECNDQMWADGGAFRTFSVMLWPLPIVFGLPALFLLRWARTAARRAKGMCTGCGYDLGGTPSGLCPECGVPAR